MKINVIFSTSNLHYLERNKILFPTCIFWTVRNKNIRLISFKFIFWDFWFKIQFFVNYK